MKTITIDGVEYKLVPVEENEPKLSERTEKRLEELKEANNRSILDDYDVAEKPVVPKERATKKKKPVNVSMQPKQFTGVEKAVPKKSEYRERFVNRELTPADILKNRKPPAPPDTSDGGFTQGEGFFGEGLTYSF